MQPHQDARVIQRHRNLTVLAQRCEVMFRDGQAIGLHPVLVDGFLQPCLRALHHEGLCWIVFDLRHLSTEIEDDLKRLQPRDHPGTVFYTLRCKYPTLAAFADAVSHHAQHSWWQHDAAPAEGLAA